MPALFVAEVVTGRFARRGMGKEVGLVVQRAAFWFAALLVWHTSIPVMRAGICGDGGKAA
jgi:hypothetical protein